MIKIPKTWMQSLANISDCSKTFLSSCCALDSRKEAPKNPKILAHITVKEKSELKFTSPQTRKFYPINQLKKMNYTNPKAPIFHYNHNNSTSINTDELLKKLNSLTLHPKLSTKELETPDPRLIIHSTATSRIQIDPIKKDLENHIAVLSGFGLEGQESQIEALQKLAQIERELIEKYRSQNQFQRDVRKISNTSGLNRY